MPVERPDAAAAYRSMAPAVLGYLRAQRVPEAEDVLGEVFLQVARDVGRFEGDEAALRRWVFSIAHNRAMDAHRRQSRDRRDLGAVVDEAAVSWPAPAAVDSGAGVGIDGVIMQALEALTPDQREVVVLRFVADLPLEAVARITGRRLGSVKALQHRALENLRKAVSQPA